MEREVLNIRKLRDSWSLELIILIIVGAAVTLLYVLLAYYICKGRLCGKCCACNNQTNKLRHGPSESDMKDQVRNEILEELRKEGAIPKLTKGSQNRQSKKLLDQLRKVTYKRGENSEEDSASIETKETFVPGGPFDVPKKKLHSGEV